LIQINKESPPVNKAYTEQRLRKISESKLV